MTVAQELTLWELAGADDKCVFSPFVWRVRMALYYKGQSYKSIPWRYTEKTLIKPAEKVTTLGAATGVGACTCCCTCHATFCERTQCKCRFLARIYASARLHIHIVNTMHLWGQDRIWPTRAAFLCRSQCWTTKSKGITSLGKYANSWTRSSLRSSCSRQTVPAVYRSLSCIHTSAIQQLV